MRRCWLPLLLGLPLSGLFLSSALLLSVLLAGGCRRDGEASPVAPPTVAPGGRVPADAVLAPTRSLREGDLVGFARQAVPPDLHAQLQDAWRAGKTRWPLDELPFSERLPTLLAALAKPGSERQLQQAFDHQFSGQTGALKTAAGTLGLFGAQYVRHQGDYSDAERQHYLQFVQALSRWGAQAPLGDPARARQAIPRLTAAARATGLTDEANFARFGMEDSLRRLAGFVGVSKQVLADYELPLDATLTGLQADVISQQGEHARVRMRYTLGGSPVEADVQVERVGGRWYLSDYLRHARAAVASPPPG